MLRHVNIIRLEEVVREKNELHLVFECMDCNLYELMASRSRPFLRPQVHSIIRQILTGLAHIHQMGFVHRDLKPENILVPHQDRIEVKICDFGSCRRLAERSVMTDYVATRWYRAPECLLRSPSYSLPIDVWAVGVMWAELVSLQPLFPGSSEMDQIFRIATVLGAPHDWPEGQVLASALRIRLPAKKESPFDNFEDKNLILQLLVWNPQKRVTANQALFLLSRGTLDLVPGEGGREEILCEIENILSS